MRYIKKFEAKKNKKDEIPNSSLPSYQRIEDYKNRCNDIDEKSEITFDQFYANLDFNIFYNSRDFVDSGVYHSNTGDSIDVNDANIYVDSSYRGRSDAKEITSLDEWKKRNIFIWAEYSTGGASGGSCWDEGDDEGAVPYEGKYLGYNDFIYDWLKYILDNIFLQYAPDKTSKELCDILSQNTNIIYTSNRCNNEYYGNYDDYECYWITLEDLFIFITQNTSL